MMFLLMLDGSFGVLSRALFEAGLWSPEHLLLATGSTALPATLLTDVWQWTPFMVVILMAGLRALPKDPYEAAARDEATSLQAFFKLTLPILSKVIAIAVRIRGVDLFGIYDYFKVKTDSAPGSSTKTDTLREGFSLPAGLASRACFFHCCENLKDNRASEQASWEEQGKTATLPSHRYFSAPAPSKQSLRYVARSRHWY